jgi:hypothetical protein
MALGTVFTLIIVPVFYSFIASEHRTSHSEEEPTLAAAARKPAHGPRVELVHGS